MDSLFAWVVLTVAVFAVLVWILFLGVRKKKFHARDDVSLWTTWASNKK